MCQFLDRLPHPAYVFLWERGPDGVFANAPPEQRRQLSAEELRFVLAVLAHDPWGELLVSLRSVGTLLTTLRLDEFQYYPEYKENFAVKVPPEHFQRMQGTAAYRGTMPIRVFAALSLATLLIGAAAIAVALAWRRTRTALDPAVVRLTAWIVAGTLANAAICGVRVGGVSAAWGADGVAHSVHGAADRCRAADAAEAIHRQTLLTHRALQRWTAATGVLSLQPGKPRGSSPPAR